MLRGSKASFCHRISSVPAQSFCNSDLKGKRHTMCPRLARHILADWHSPCILMSSIGRTMCPGSMKVSAGLSHPLLAAKTVDLTLGKKPKRASARSPSSNSIGCDWPDKLQFSEGHPPSESVNFIFLVTCYKMHCRMLRDGRKKSLLL
jgi:hypothetical protein